MTLVSINLSKNTLPCLLQILDQGLADITEANDPDPPLLEREVGGKPEA